MKLAAGAELIPELSKYPQAAATMQPIKRPGSCQRYSDFVDVCLCFHRIQRCKRSDEPRTTAQLFMIGDPNRSQRMMVTNTKNPSPMNSALPHGKACGASTSGHSLKNPDSGRSMHPPAPPAQFSKPDDIRETPIRSTVGPVTRGGKICFL